MLQYILVGFKIQMQYFIIKKKKKELERAECQKQT